MNEVVRKQKRVNKAEEKVELICYYFFAFAAAYFLAGIVEYVFRNLFIDAREKLFSSASIAFFKSVLSVGAYATLLLIAACFIFAYQDAKRREARNNRRVAKRKRNRRIEIIEHNKKVFKARNFFHIQMIRPSSRGGW